METQKSSCCKSNNHRKKINTIFFKCANTKIVAVKFVCESASIAACRANPLVPKHSNNSAKTCPNMSDCVKVPQKKTKQQQTQPSWHRVSKVGFKSFLYDSQMERTAKVCGPLKRMWQQLFFSVSSFGGIFLGYSSRVLSVFTNFIIKSEIFPSIYFSSSLPNLRTSNIIFPSNKL